MTRLCLAVALASFVASPAVAQTTWYVDGAAAGPGTGALNDPYTSIQFAISAPSTLSGDTILIASGVYLEHIDFVGKDLHIAGEGAGTTFLDGSNSGRVVRFSPGSDGVLRDLTIRNGRAMGAGQMGGGVLVEGGSPELRRLVIRECAAQFGGGIAVSAGSPWVVDCTLTTNGVPLPATQAGAGIYAAPTSTPLVESCDLTYNRYTLFGGAIAGAGDYRSCSIEENFASHGGGANALGCSLSFDGCTISNNMAASVFGDLFEGGGVIGPATLLHCTLSNNLANYFGGGAVDCTLTECTLSNNRLDNFNTSNVVVAGAGASNSTLVDCVVSSNRVGGGVGSVDFLRGDGAGIADSIAIDTLFLDNLARNGRGGAAVRSSLSGCTLEGNEARLGATAGTGIGGGAFECTLTRCVVKGNLADYGGGVADSSLEHCTLARNHAQSAGGAAYETVGASTYSNSILWDNAPDQIEDASSLLDVRYCVVQGGWQGVAILSSDPRFVGPMSGDEHLRSDSPCIDAGDPLGSFDADGSVSDIGALPFDPQYCAAPGAWCVGKVNSQGCAPEIHSTGSTRLSGPDDLVIGSTRQVEHKSGFLFWSHGAMFVPFYSAIRCVGPVTVRTPFQNSNGDDPPATCTGSFSYPFTHAYAAAQGLAAGDTIYMQWFSRDPAHPDGTGVSLSNSLEVSFCP